MEETRNGRDMESIWKVMERIKEKVKRSRISNQFNKTFFEKWNKLLQFNGYHGLIFALLLTFGIYFGLFFCGITITDPYIESEKQAEKRVLKLCNFLEDNNLTGDEGSVMESEWKLIGISVVIRHGDRYSFRKTSNECQKLTDYEREQFMNYGKIAKEQKLINILNISKTFGNMSMLPGKEACSFGELTPRGAIQGFNIGRFLSEKYKNTSLFAKKSPTMNITSTLKQRTFATSIAFLSGFLNGNTFKTPISVNSADTYNVCADQFCDCPNYLLIKKFHAAEREGIFRMTMGKNWIDFLNYLKNSFEEYKATIDPVQLLDYSLSEYICQRRPLECQDKEHCMDFTKFDKYFNFVNKRAPTMFDSNTAFERRYQILGSFPVLSYISDQINKGRSDVQLFATHDFIVYAILRTLSVPCDFQQIYAARLVFEIYENMKNEKVFRLLYNGVDRTADISFCKDHLKNGMCDSNELTKFLTADIFELAGFKTFNQTCTLN